MIWLKLAGTRVISNKMAAIKRRVHRGDLQRDPYAAWNALVDVIAYSKHYGTMSEIQRAPHLAFRYESEVQNGGHLQFFENEPVDAIEQTLVSLGVLGADVYVPILSEAINRRRSRPRQSLQSGSDYVEEALGGEFADLDLAYYNAQPSMIKLLEDYLHQWQDEFIIVEC